MKYLICLLMCCAAWIANADELVVVEMQPGASATARYVIAGQKMSFEKLGATLTQKVISTANAKDTTQIAVLVDNRVPIKDVSNLTGLLQKIGFSHFRYFQFSVQNKDRLSEIKVNFNPVITRGDLEKVMSNTSSSN